MKRDKRWRSVNNAGGGSYWDEEYGRISVHYFADPTLAGGPLNYISSVEEEQGCQPESTACSRTVLYLQCSCMEEFWFRVVATVDMVVVVGVWCMIHIEPSTCHFLHGLCRSQGQCHLAEQQRLSRDNCHELESKGNQNHQHLHEGKHHQGKQVLVVVTAPPCTNDR